jgi:hypothetical protein
VGMSRGGVYRWMQRYGIPRRPSALRLSSDDAAPSVSRTTWVPQSRLEELWVHDRMDVRRIATSTRLSTAVVRDRLIAAGMLPRPKPGDNYVLVGAPDDPLSRQTLEDMYLGRRLVPREIAEETGTTVSKVQYRLRVYGIPRRRPGTRPVLEDLTAELLRYLYLERGLSTPKIAALMNCSIPSVRQRLMHVDISRHASQ